MESYAAGEFFNNMRWCLNLNLSEKHATPRRNIDAGIADAVHFFNAHGFQTIGSCEGGDGHLFDLPTIQVRSDGDIDDARKRICRFLIQQGIRGFTAKSISMHQNSESPEPYSYVEIEFWDQEILRYLTI